MNVTESGFKNRLLGEHDLEKKTCSLKKKLCMNSLHCVLYKKKK